MRAAPLRRRELPLRENPAGRALAWLARFLVCLSVVAFAVAAGAQGRLRQLALEPRLVTVAIPPDAAGPVTEAELAAAIGALRALPGVIGLRLLETQELLPLLPSGTGDAQLLAALPLPRLIELALDPAASAGPCRDRRCPGCGRPEAVVGEPVSGGGEGAAAIRRLQLLGWAGGALALVSLVAGSVLVVRAPWPRSARRCACCARWVPARRRWRTSSSSMPPATACVAPCSASWRRSRCWSCWPWRARLGRKPGWSSRGSPWPTGCG